MGIIDNLFKDTIEKRVKEQLDVEMQKQIKPLDTRFLQQLFSNNGEILTSDQNDKTYRDKGYRQNPTVRSIISTIQKNAGMAKWNIFKRMSDGTKKPYDDAFLRELLYRPNGLDTWNYLIQAAIGNKLLYGNTYLWGIPDAFGKVGSLHVLPADRVQIVAADNKRGIEGYELDYFGRSPEEMIPADEIYHIKTWNPRYDGNGSFLYGISPLHSAMTSLYSNNEALTTMRSYLLNQGPRGFVSMMMDEGMALSEAQHRHLENSFKQNDTGVKNAGKIKFMPTKADYVSIGSSSADLQLIEHYNLSKEDLCNIYSFPSLLLGSGESSYANQKEAKKALWNNVIIPALCEIRDGLNYWLAPKFGKNLCIDFDLGDIHDLQEDFFTQAKSLDKLQGLYTVNEVRAKLGDAPLDSPEGNELYIFRQGVEDSKKEDSDGSEAEQEG